MKKQVLKYSFVALLSMWHTGSLAQKTGEVFTFGEKKYKVTGQNLITNPSFENGFTGWTSANDFKTELSPEKFELTESGAQDGTKCLTPLKNEGSTGNGSIGTKWEIALGKTYVFSFYMKHTKSPGPHQYIKTSLTNKPGTEEKVLSFPETPTVNEWCQYQEVFENTDGYPYLQIIFRWLTNQKEFAFDNFVLSEVQELVNTDGLKEVIEKANTELASMDKKSNGYALLEATIQKAQDLLETATVPEEVSNMAKHLNNVIRYAKEGIYEATADKPLETTLIVNGTFDTDQNGWDYNSNVPNHGLATNKGGDITGKYFENYQFDSFTGGIYQVLNDIPNGIYVLKAASFRDQTISGGNPQSDAVRVYANSDETIVTSTDGVYYYVTTEVTDGKLEVGVKSIEKNFRWMGIDNVSLTYYGECVKETIALQIAKTQWDKMKTESNKTLDDLAIVKGQLRTDLENALNATLSETSASYKDATRKAGHSLIAFGLGRTAYQTLYDEIEYAKTFNTDVKSYNELLNSNTASLTEVEKAVFNLKIDEYNGVTKNYPHRVNLIGDIKDWQGDMVQNKGQHWSNNANTTYYEQKGEQWGASSWKVYKEHKVKLPAGKYVLVGTGRGSNETTLTMSVENQSCTFPKNGDIGFGIDIHGKPAFDGTGEYANNNKGRGWEYRYCGFELKEAKEITIRIDASAQSAHQWVSISDIALYTMPTDITFNMTSAGWGTLILPYEHEIPEGLEVYSCNEVNEQNVLTLVPETEIAANTPYIVKGKEGAYPFTGMSTATNNSYTAGLLTGIFTPQVAIVGTYVLQDQKDWGVNFYKVTDVTPEIAAYRAYMNAPASMAGANISVFQLTGGTTSVSGITAETPFVDVYNLNGTIIRKGVKANEALNGLPKGIYIVNGTKKAIK